MKARIKWVQDMTFLGESGSGHSVVMDGAPASGGRDLGIRPMEMLLLGLGGCTAFDVVLILLTFALVRFAHLHVPTVILIVAPLAIWWHRPRVPKLKAPDTGDSTTA